MKHSFKNSLIIIMVTVALIISAPGVTPAYADEGTPPPPATEEPILPLTEESTQPSVVVTESPVVPTEPSVDPTPIPDVPEEAVPAEDVPVTELLSEVPESTDVVALDENGEPLPLAAQDAAEALMEADPKWCPEGVLPNGATCSINFPSIGALLADMQSNPGFYSQNGVIYFERASITIFTSSFVLDDSPSSLGTSYDALKAYSITLTGGWAGGTSTSLGSTSRFSGPDAFIQVGMSSNPWAGNVSLNNIQIGTTSAGVSANNSLTVYTSSGTIDLKNVDVLQQEGDHYTAYLQSSSGNITISNGSSFDGRNTGGNLNKGLAAITGSGSISISNSTFREASGGSSTNYNGATLSAPVVNLTNVIARNNDGSGIYVNGMGSTIVNLFGGSYNNNGQYGVQVTGSILNQQSTPTCTGNGSGCYNVTPNATPTVAVNDITVEADASSGWTLAFSAIGSAGDAEDGTPLVSCTPTLGSLLPIGVTTVSCTVKDSGGLTASASGSVEVVDTTAPALSLPSDITVAETGPAGEVVTYAVSATDVVDGAVAVSCAPVSGSTFSLGTTSVNCSAADGSGNTALGSFKVTVNDTGAPVLSLPADISIVVSKPSKAIVNYSAFAVDTVEGLAPVSCVPASGSLFPEGTTEVKCAATDSSGNTTYSSFNVSVDVSKVELYSIIKQTEAQLPSALGQGDSFGSALKLEFTDQAAKTRNLKITLSFPIPDNMKDADLVVFFWDGSEWVVIPGGSVVGSYFVIHVTRPGFYVLVNQ